MKPLLPVLLPIALLALSLAGCTARTEAPVARYASLDRLVDGGALGAPGDERRAPSRPVLRLPAWVGAQSLRATRGDAAAFVQEIDLAAGARDGDGGDFAEIRVQRAAAPDPEAGAPRRPTEAGIRAELAALFPDVAMQVVARPARNAYGPYGLAVGRRADGLRCLYAWQWLEPEGAGAASLRLRLCRARTPLDALAGAIDHLGFDPAGLASEPGTAPRPRVRGAAVRRGRPVRVAAAPPASRPATSQQAWQQAQQQTWQQTWQQPSPQARAATPQAAFEHAPSAPARTELPAEALRGPQRGLGAPITTDMARR